ncbi:MAG: NADH:ubiquinone oxidoreductase subunit NDUFA12 [Alphaproteobacteria bacterium]|jgi:NADH:ubiquinone oxidoreductase subunit|nr:NADH:ubiquinone oxidoreductase subunit NDUFA12 [Alphaproteobacteria bacterium]MBP9878431.1 NADH:ubiquinone oxidoreductase subunit NDUFA12 [Alphaproteobacteria bacterium]
MNFIEKIILFMTKLHVNTFTFRYGRYVGEDQFGNRYFEEKNPRNPAAPRRWALYKGEQEATKIPPEWDGWLHHMIDEPLSPHATETKPWIKPHQENLTGSFDAYRPEGHFLKGGKRQKATGDYNAWRPTS